MNEIRIFNNPQLGEVRVAVTENSEPMFRLADACKALGEKAATYLYKKIVHGTQRALDKDIARRKLSGWEVVRYEKVPRGRASRLFTYVAFLTRIKI